MATKSCNFIFLFIIGFFSSCSNQFDNVERGQYGHQFAREFGKVIKNKYHITFSGTGGGYYDGKIQCINIDFSINEPYELEKARSLMRNIICEFKEVSNQNKESLVYFPDQKFSYDNVHMIIYYETNHETEGLASFIGGKILYKISKPNVGPYELIAWENYDEGILHFKGEPGPYDKPLN